MSLFEILVILLVALLVIKPDDIPAISRNLGKFLSFFEKTKRDIFSQLDIIKESEDFKGDYDQINFFLEKISKMGGHYEGDYDLEKIKSYYNSLVKERINSESNKEKL